MEALQNYQQVERDYRARYKQRVERQFRIGAPVSMPVSSAPLKLISCSETKCYTGRSQRGRQRHFGVG